MTFTFERISEREKHITELTAQGHSCKEIARMLGLAEITVLNQRSRLIRYLGFRNSPQLTAEYIKFKYGHR